MPIPAAHTHRSIYHFTHIDNLPGLLQTGFLANNHQNFPQNGHRTIAARGIQQRRAIMDVTCGPRGVVHDYVPLYFGSVSPMLLQVINCKNVDQMDIVYFEFPITLVNRDDVVFTDASANTAIPPNFYSDPAFLDHLNWEAIDSRSWGSVNDVYKHQRMAEVLVHSALPFQQAQRVVVWNEAIRGQLTEHVRQAGVTFPPIVFEDSRIRPHYFLNFMEGTRQSIVTGPREIALKFSNASDYIIRNIGTVENQTAPFQTLQDLLDVLRIDFGCLYHTSEVIDLVSENPMHRCTVGDHSQDVVRRLMALDEFGDFAPDDKSMLELAAYLHDIGKGPRARWVENNGVQRTDPNHAVRAIPMVVDIVLQQVRHVIQEAAVLLLKLVCYHDLVGEVLGKGRNEQQIIDVATNELELNMLFVLGKADATSLVEFWWDDDNAQQLSTRCLAAIRLRGIR